MAQTAVSLDIHGSRAELQSLQQSRVLDTPRTREACKKLGLVVEDLQFRSYESFYIPGDHKDKQQKRFKHFEQKRKDRLGQVLAERAKVIAANAKKGEVPGAQSGQFLSMLESLFEKEAKRLETDLKSQLRQHSALVKENEDQLKKESQLQEKKAYREHRRMEAESSKSELGEKTRQKLEERFNRQGEIVEKLNADFAGKQDAHRKMLIAEEERLERFNEDKRQLAFEKSSVWRDKVEAMKEKSELMQLERQRWGESKLAEIEARIGAVQTRREEEQHQRQMKSEEQHLHIMDVREQKNILDRQDGYRREGLKDQIDANVDRIETLLALKDQLLDQRKARTLKAEAQKNSRGLNLRRDCAPGPGQYEAPPSCIGEIPGVKIAQSKVGHSEFIDQVTKVTAANPAPGQYDSLLTANGDRLDKVAGAVGFGNRNRDSYLDDAMKAKDFVPAPGRYEAKTQLDQRAVKMRRERINDQGTDKHAPKRFPVWARPATETPGPAGYSVDDYTRKEVLRRAQRSLPNLTRDMVKAGPRPSI